MGFIRETVENMQGYVPGEQPTEKLIKLNTNENPYPPSPAVFESMANFDMASLNKYPHPMSDAARDAAAALFGKDKNWICAGNGSDDILTIAIRTCVNAGEKIAVLDPTYSLYPVLAEIQDAQLIEISTNDDFSLPLNLIEQAGDAKLLILTSPNAPTSNAFPLDVIDAICANFKNAVLIDEAYADFSSTNCSSLVDKYDNVIISRTVSKSYSLAGIRFGYAYAQPAIIEQFMKVKDSYNINTLTQVLAEAALKDQAYFQDCISKIINTREFVIEKLNALGFETVQSEANFIFAKVPCDAQAYMNEMRENKILLRYFNNERCKEYVRITIGTDEEMDTFLQVTEKLINRQVNYE
ncbi:MAG: histidinol-phosphate transaminase [Lentisphaeria bacterium]|nr:histidinol-phosphate transaminase [Lentisphaeria bacterium]NQZ68872.1 histidinol-phosphate transaminase [Lentisphaeria bacterium]